MDDATLYYSPSSDTVTAVEEPEVTPMQAAWSRIRRRAEDALVEVDRQVTAAGWLPWGYESGLKSINDEVQKEYREGRITEPERDAMRGHVKVWLGDPAVDPYMGYAKYSCGMWAPSVSPLDVFEHAIILSTLVILEEEAA